MTFQKNVNVIPSSCRKRDYGGNDYNIQYNHAKYVYFVTTSPYLFKMQERHTKTSKHTHVHKLNQFPKRI